MRLFVRLLAPLALTLVGISTGAVPEWISPAATGAQATEQALVRFDSAMVAFGDPNPLDPFVLDCPVKGHGSWADPWNWIFDFDYPLPGGMKCSFRPKIAFRDLRDQAPSWRSYTFQTGAPRIQAILPEASEYDEISEDQVFVLRGWSKLDSAQIAQNAYCAVPQMGGQKIPVQVTGKSQLEQWKQLPLSPLRYFLQKSSEEENRTLYSLALRCKQNLPSGAEMELHLPMAMQNLDQDRDRGSASQAILAYQVRGPLSATMSCTKVNAKAGCVPFLGMELNFSAAISPEQASQISLLDSSGHALPGLHWDSTEEIQQIRIDTLPQSSKLSLWLPPNLHDLEGRPLSNAKNFPLKFRSDAPPALAKFNGRFGILELKNPVLPLSLRNLEPKLKGKQISLPAKELRLAAGSDAKVRRFYNLLDSVNERGVNPNDTLVQSGEYPLLQKSDQPQSFEISRTLSDQSLEVVGINLKNPGFYIVEVQSPRLGAEQFSENKPYYVQTGVLVTNLSIHLKLGTTNGLAWVTSLDQGLPQKDVKLRASDCQGRTLWEGTSNEWGLAELPGQIDRDLKCPLMVSATQGDDYSFVMSDWNSGLSPWNFLGGGYYDEDHLQLYNANNEFHKLFHIAMDRTLLRAGETLHFKTWMRQMQSQGLDMAPDAEGPQELKITHLGSDEEFPLELDWQNGSALGDWTIPKTAPSGSYQLSMSGQDLGIFRVEEFRVPLMSASITSPRQILAGKSIPLNLEAHYLNGGGAGHLNFQLSAQWQNREIPEIKNPLYRNYSFGQGAVEVGKHSYEEDMEYEQSDSRTIQNRKLKLDRSGQLQMDWDSLVPSDRDQDLLLQMQYRDPSGAWSYAYKQVEILSSEKLVGLGNSKWNSSGDTLTLRGAVLDRKYKAMPGQKLHFQLYRSHTQSHRKRLFGGFYGYDNQSWTEQIPYSCDAQSDADGMAYCRIPLRQSQGIEVELSSQDAAGKTAKTHSDIWAYEGEYWSEQSDNDRIDLIPAKEEWEIGDTARFQVRCPFRQASLLITIEREGVIQHFVKQYSSDQPYIQFPVTEAMGPNAYVSALLIRGRLDPEQGILAKAEQMAKDLANKWGLLPDQYSAPTGTVDLAKPSFKMGLAQFKVNLAKQKLQIQIQADRGRYAPRDSAWIDVQVKNAQGQNLAGGEIALAVVDEGLLQLAPNLSWDLWESMYPLRALEVNTATAQSLVIGKRHFGRKTLAPGGGGGTAPNRELFETLQYWNGRIPLDAQGHARISFRLGDALTSYRIVAMAQGGSALFGTAQTSIQSAQGLSILPALPPSARSGDSLDAEFTLRNSTEMEQKVQLSARMGKSSKDLNTTLPNQEITLPPQSSKQVFWKIALPTDDSLYFQVQAKGSSLADQMTKGMDLIPAGSVRVQQSILLQIKGQDQVLPIQMPASNFGRAGGLRIALSKSLGGQLDGVVKYMRDYPYRCMEQQLSRAVALGDSALWAGTMAELPQYLDRNGLVRYFPNSWNSGSEVLSSYLLSIAQSSGRAIPTDLREQIIQGLIQFVQNPRLKKGNNTPDLSLRRISALSAISRYQKIDPSWLGGLQIRPDLWPSSALLDWVEINLRNPELPGSKSQVSNTLQELRKRYRYQGGAILWTGEKNEDLWWLMSNPDVNSQRLFLLALQVPAWANEIPQMAQGLLLRQNQGRWSSTVANAWGALALRAFARKYEKTPVSGTTTLSYGGLVKTFDWKTSKGIVEFPWAEHPDSLRVHFEGSGQPWLSVQSLAQIESEQPRDFGYQVKRTLIPLQKANPNKWSVGDLYRVDLEINARAEMSWVALDDPIPSGSSIINDQQDQSLDPMDISQAAWEERTSVYYRAFFAWLPKGSTHLSYTVRLGQSGFFQLPPTRIEAMYLPNMFGEYPRSSMRVE